MPNSRTKGAGGERQVAKILFDELGIVFKRELRQTQDAGYGDLTSDPCTGFSIEVKTYAKGTGCKDEWWAQSKRGAELSGLIPVVIYKFDRRPWRVEMPLGYFMPDGHDQRVNVSIETFAYIAREKVSNNDLRFNDKFGVSRT